ncbi:MAG TPA: hypothetical protein VGL05_06660 [Kribbella sp.]
MHKSFGRRIVAAGAGLGLAAGAFIGIGALQADAATQHTSTATAAAVVKKSVTIDSSDWIVPKWSKVRYFGKTTGIAKGTKVQVQRLEGRKWVNFPATTTVTSRGTYSVYVASGKVGKFQFRVVVAGVASKPCYLTITK